MTTDPLLAVDNLQVSIALANGHLHAVRGVSFEVNKGESFCIVGESGCGKSLSSFALMGLLPRRAVRSAKALNFAGIDLLSISKRQMARQILGQRMAMIFQEPMTSLNPVYTIGEQLCEVLHQHQRIPTTQARERAVFLLERVGITAAAKRLRQYPHQLSGGLRQRVMIAMALMCSPELLICDEPTTALDVTIQAQILRVLNDLRKEFDMAVLLITHDLGVVSRIADKVAVMYAGEFVETGSVKQIFSEPMHPYTQGLLRCIPIPGQVAHGEKLGSIPGMVPTLMGKIEGCVFKSRCAYAHDACQKGTPPLVNLGSDHSYRCVLPAEDLKKHTQQMRAAS